jgi:dienelactone hydrolase
MVKTFVVSALAIAGACGGDDGGGGSPDGGSPDAAGPDADPGLLAELPCTDTSDSIYADPGTLSGTKGAIVRCARDADLSLDALRTKLDDHGYNGPLTSGAHVYRVLYETERGTATPTPDVSSALVYLPDVPRAASLPIVIANHGSRGQASACAPSRSAPDADFERLTLTLVGNGFAVIAPDLAGYANDGGGQPLSGYGVAADVARSSLDGGRALRNVIPTHVTDDVLLVGHSLGGHTALSALALADSYGTGGTIAGVAVYAPLWITPRTWGTIPGVASVFPFSTAPAPNAISIWYHYTAAELAEGAGHGVDVFRPEVRTSVQAFVESQCWGQGAWDYLPTLGADATAVFDPSFISSVSGAAGGFVADCNEGPNPDPALCQKWLDRYQTDRPHLTGTAATVPIVLAWGSSDPLLTPDRITCAIDRLRDDVATNLSVCVDVTADHNTVIHKTAPHFVRWIASRTLGESAPGACPRDETAIVDTSGDPILCATIPPND